MSIHRFTAMEGKHLAFIRSLPCAACGVCIGIEAAHVRYPDALAGKPMAGMGAKPDFFWTIPLCTGCHRDQHERGDERVWWALRGFDPDSPSLSILTLCVALWRVTGDTEAGKAEIAQHRMNVRMDRRERTEFALPPQIERPVKRWKRKKGMMHVA